MNNTRQHYEALEQQTLLLDGADDELAEKIREVMDFVWFHRLSAQDRSTLNARGTVEIAEPILVAVEKIYLYVQDEDDPPQQHRQTISDADYSKFFVVN